MSDDASRLAVLERLIFGDIAEGKNGVAHNQQMMMLDLYGQVGEREKCLQGRLTTAEARIKKLEDKVIYYTGVAVGGGGVSGFIFATVTHYLWR